MNKLVWEDTQGPSGAYQITSKEANKDSAEWQALLKDLDEHGGKLSRKGFFVWKFQNSEKVGRKKRKY